MITKIEIKNFQSHKNTVLDFDKGVNVICGESDNGKSAVIRAIRWVVENYPQGIDKINSNWNENLKEPLSVKLYTDKGCVERIRDKTRNGYNICKTGEQIVKLDAIGKGVPKEVTEFLNVSDVNFQFQMDPPYLLSKTPGQASEYLNEIVHLDSIDKIMSIADSDKRQLSSEQKTVEADIKKLENDLKNYEWVDEADKLYARTKKLQDMVHECEGQVLNLNSYIEQYEKLSIVDLSEHDKLIKQIEDISIPDYSELENSITSYENCTVVDLSEALKLCSEIDSIIVCDTKELEDSIISYCDLSEEIKGLDDDIVDLKNKLPDFCPYCGAKLDKEKLECS